MFENFVKLINDYHKAIEDQENRGPEASRPRNEEEGRFREEILQPE
jgi:hypothetical protein